jgi:signal transduction histidine kinase
MRKPYLPQLIFLLLIFKLISTSAWAQNSKRLDSLQKVYHEAKADTAKILTLIEIAATFRQQKADTSIVLAQSALNQSEKIKFNKGKVQSWQVISQVYWQKNKYEEAMMYANKGLELAQKIKFNKGISSNHTNLGLVYSSQADYSKATFHFKEALKINQAINDKPAIASALNNIALMYDFQSEYRMALQHHLDALKIRESIKDKRGIGQSLNNIAGTYDNLQEDSLALVYHLKSLNIKKELQDKRGIAQSLTGIGLIYDDQHEYQKALEYHRESLKLREEIKDRIGIANSLNNIGVAYKKMKAIDQALEHYQKAYLIQSEINDKRGMTFTQANIAEIFQEKKEYDLSNQHAQKAYALAQETNQSKEMQRIADIIAKNYKALQQYDKALSYLELSHLIHDSIFTIDKRKAIANLESKYELDKNQKEMKILEKDKKLSQLEAESKAKQLAYITKQNEADRLFALAQKEKDQRKADSLLNLAQKNQLAADKLKAEDEKLKLEYKAKTLENIQQAEERDFQRKLLYLALVCLALLLALTYRIYLSRQKEIKAKQEINQQKEEILSQAEELRTINQQLVDLDSYKQNMTLMIVHDLKNPLNVLLNLPTNSETQTTLQVKNYAEQMQRMVLNILDVQKFEESEMTFSKESFTLKNITVEAIHQVEFLSSQKNIVFQRYFTHNPQVYADKEMITRVIVNLLTNAIKYSPLNASIEIKISAEDSQAIFSVKDKGIGIPSDKLSTVFDKFVQIQAKDSGTMRSSGLGLTYCQLAIKAHEGHIGVNSVEGEGAEFWFELPISNIESQSNIQSAESIINGIKSPTLTQEDKAVLMPYLAQLKEQQVYFVSELENILRQIDFNQNERLSDWLLRLRNAIYTSNQVLYQQIINEISDVELSAIN